MIAYDEDAMFPVPRALFFQMRQALRFYARQGNYADYGASGIKPVLRDHGRRAEAALIKVDALLERHERALSAKYEALEATER